MSRTLLNWGPTTNSSSPYLVPPIMHYIAIDMTPPYPAKWLAARASCVALHPTWTFMYWDTASATAFIQREHPTLLKQWQSYRVPIQRADTLRYLLLYTYGGTYLDMDLECKRPLDPFRKFEFIAPAAHPVGISNGFIMAAPTHPFLAQVVSQLPLFNLNFGFPYLTVMFSSGCMYISAQHVTSPLRNEHLKVLGGKRNRLSGRVETPLFRHLGASSWHEGDAKLFSVLGKAVQAIPIFGSESEKSSSSSSSA
ncbi:nucleotide-diphospho-sugar transferase [Phlyctochytrium arcticum]|nr:nucleotide-diphospho-sugar transferase [Phlyctochytrium arcticum]